MDATIFLALGVLAFAVKVWALVDACVRPSAAYVAADKLTKPAWVAILAVAVVLTGFNFAGLLGLIAVVAAVVYLVDVRPAVRGMRPGGPWA